MPQPRPPSTTDSYEATWRRLDRLRAWMLGVLFAGPAALALSTHAFPAPPGEASNVVVVVGFTWIAAVGVTGAIRNSTRCPRCHKEFFIRREPIFYNHFTDKCLNCGLPRGEGSLDE